MMTERCPGEHFNADDLARWSERPDLCDYHASKTQPEDVVRRTLVKADNVCPGIEASEALAALDQLVADSDDYARRIEAALPLLKLWQGPGQPKAVVALLRGEGTG